MATAEFKINASMPVSSTDVAVETEMVAFVRLILVPIDSALWPQQMPSSQEEV